MKLVIKNLYIVYISLEYLCLPLLCAYKNVTFLTNPSEKGQEKVFPLSEFASKI